jgi:hypothetical protein
MVVKCIFNATSVAWPANRNSFRSFPTISRQVKGQTAAVGNGEVGSTLHGAVLLRVVVVLGQRFLVLTN